MNCLAHPVWLPRPVWLPCLFWLTLAAWLAGSTAADAADTPPARSRTAIDDACAASLRDLSRRATEAGDTPLAEMIAAWPLPAAGDQQLAVRIPARIEKPEAIDTPVEESIWSDFLAARRARATGLLEHAVYASGAHDRPPSRARPAAADEAAAPPLPQRSCAVVQLLHEALRDDPDNARGREAAGWVRRDGSWVWPEVAKRLGRGEAFDPAFGWMAAAKLARHRAGERNDRGRWVSAAEDEARPRDVRHGRDYHSDHWEIVSPAGLADAAELAERLEETRAVWRQVFGAYRLEPQDLEKLLAGRGRPAAAVPHAAILCAGRGQYLAELEPLEPRIGITHGIYWTPTKTIWFFTAADTTPPEPDPVTIHHEATHQLFSEGRADAMQLRQAAGERCGFWAIEAAACYMESLQPTSFGWTVGGRDAGRAPAARERLAAGVHVPLADLCGMGREAFQSHDQLRELYDQIAGQADFFMNGEAGRYREPFVEYLSRVYRGTADPDSLARLCRRSCAELDDAYRRHLLR